MNYTQLYWYYGCTQPQKENKTKKIKPASSNNTSTTKIIPEL
jgi:hypothetical protein